LKITYFSDLKKEFHGYNGSKFLGDLMAGITVAAVALPLALAFGVSSGASAAAGMITAVLAGVIIAALSGASYQISGPTGAMAAILIAVSAQYGVKGVMLAGFLSGIILLLISVFKIGRLVSYIPAPVITGFTSGIALVIAAGQIDNFFGTTSRGHGVLEKFQSYGELGFNPDVTTMLFGIGAMLIMILWPKKPNSKVPGSLVAIIVALIVNMIFNFQSVAVVGEIPQTLFLEDRLTLKYFNTIDMKDVMAIVPTAFSIAALGMIESLLCGASAGKMKDEKLNADRELVAQGIGNIVIPFFGGVPATAAIARTSVAIKSGQRTRLTSIIHSVILLAAMFLLGPVMSKIPLAALAGVLMVTAWRMNEWNLIKYFFKNKFNMAVIQFLVTMVVTLFFELTVAIIVGIAVSMILFVVKSGMTVDVSEVEGEGMENVRIVYVEGPLFFGTQEKLFTELYKFEPHIDTLIISMRGVPTLDESVIEEFASFFGNLHRGGINVNFCGIVPQVKKMFDRSGLAETLGEGKFHYDVIAAVKSLEK
jgi:SulP family sulfate permease